MDRISWRKVSSSDFVIRFLSSISPIITNSTTELVVKLPRTAQFIEETQAAKDTESPENTQPIKEKKKRGDGARIAAWKWKPGQSGNPGGRPKNDVAKAICQAVFEHNADEIYKGLAAELIAGKAYTLQVAAERAYGKLKETHEHSISDELVKRLMEGRKRANGNR